MLAFLCLEISTKHKREIDCDFTWELWDFIKLTGSSGVGLLTSHTLGMSPIQLTQSPYCKATYEFSYANFHLCLDFVSSLDELGHIQ